MDDKHSLVFIKDEDDLEIPAATRLAPNEPFVVFDLPGKRTLRAADDGFRVSGRNAVLGDVLDVPLVPTEVHELLMQ